MWNIYKIRSMHLNIWTDKKALMILVDHGRTTNRALRRLHHPLLCCISLSPTLVRLSLKRGQRCGTSIPITHRSSTILFPGLWLKRTGLFQSPEAVSSLIISCLTMHLTLLHHHGHSNFCSDAVSNLAWWHRSNLNFTVPCSVRKKNDRWIWRGHDLKTSTMLIVGVSTHKQSSLALDPVYMNQERNKQTWYGAE
jgi:hypothetical protein